MIFRPPQPNDFFRALRTVAYLVFNASQLISAAISIFASSLGVALVAWLLQKAQIALYFATFSAGILIALLIVGISYWRSFPYRWLVRGYRWIRAEYTYQVHEDDIRHHSQTIKIMLEAISPGVDHFENRYFWTGSGTEKDPIVLSPGHKMMGSTLPRAGWKFYYIHLGRELNVGDQVEVQIYQELFDEDDKFEPFLAKTVIEPLDNLTLRVILPKNKPALQILHQETHSDAPTFTLIKQTNGEYDQRNSEIEWLVPRPVIGHRYVITWRW